ncbi:uncharacterized protein LOC128795544 [Vidua chalybeata]|uniref:uncharacterized protein LOC128795544 n=1 Tax=Vidua chalybeata TaxID=81927 RepID=UPI0023A860BD|nr:uncharacterized protein LOC128795544 [Vidua chalybeata]XP_053812369.1 uncharacterized protein LOC128795544 [Vidua chalybeata]XP_053812379.1 uncharacterized protein LOC128795544 [Vidua chalybeata]XP_053812388.1 uncharacterized protein LOC128795544 [Vidua chalybeata]XP_053812396.1 uncharacterized protein LOC128795544 [Vidua chalybeata]
MSADFDIGLSCVHGPILALWRDLARVNGISIPDDDFLEFLEYADTRGFFGDLAFSLNTEAWRSLYFLIRQSIMRDLWAFRYMKVYFELLPIVQKWTPFPIIQSLLQVPPREKGGGEPLSVAQKFSSASAQREPPPPPPPAACEPRPRVPSEGAGPLPAEAETPLRPPVSPPAAVPPPPPAHSELGDTPAAESQPEATSAGAETPPAPAPAPAPASELSATPPAPPVIAPAAAAAPPAPAADPSTAVGSAAPVVPLAGSEPVPDASCDDIEDPQPAAPAEDLPAPAPPPISAVMRASPPAPAPAPAPLVPAAPPPPAAFAGSPGAASSSEQQQPGAALERTPPSPISPGSPPSLFSAAGAPRQLLAAAAKVKVKKFSAFLGNSVFLGPILAWVGDSLRSSRPLAPPAPVWGAGGMSSGNAAAGIVTGERGGAAARGQRAACRPNRAAGPENQHFSGKNTFSAEPWGSSCVMPSFEERGQPRPERLWLRPRPGAVRDEHNAGRLAVTLAAWWGRAVKMKIPPRRSGWDRLVQPPGRRAPCAPRPGLGSWLRPHGPGPPAAQGLKACYLLGILIPRFKKKTKTKTKTKLLDLRLIK